MRAGNRHEATPIKIPVAMPTFSIIQDAACAPKLLIHHLASLAELRVMPTATLSKKQREALLKVLKARFENNMRRHEGGEWADIEARLVRKGGALWSLGEMERTGGEPDVIGRDKETGNYVFCDCSAESPEGRRNVCYDHRGQEKGRRKACAWPATFWIWQPI
jgi:hypothetical protein